MGEDVPDEQDRLPAPVYQDERVTVYQGDAVELLPRLPAAGADALVSDPPYGLGFAGHTWDAAAGFAESLHGLDVRAMSGAQVFEAWCAAWAHGALHALKPGAHLAAFGGARTWHRMVRGVEDAGFEIRDQIAWLHTAGMPKSMDISHAIDKHSGATRHDRIVQLSTSPGGLGTTRSVASRGTPVTGEAQAWEGWGTGLRPAFEPIIVARKPPDGSLVTNVLTHGVGGLNIEGTRFGEGRWPTNVALDQQQADALDLLTGTWQSRPLSARFPIFRFEGKASPAERPRAFGRSHATVKPLGLMRWLVTLITPRGGLVLEPFAGSGTTVEAAVQTGFRVIAFEKDPDYVPLIIARIDRISGPRRRST
ncbi:MAG: site-specific DNA-methyltransferase [Cellulomonas sp.]|nr:site-specific DNA-methyltransferase [Cellulomonas sp.]